MRHISIKVAFVIPLHNILLKTTQKMTSEALKRFLAMSKVMVESKSADTTTAPFQPHPEDVIIVGCIKSGTTWLQQIVHQIRTKGDEVFDNINEIVPFISEYNYSSHINRNDAQKAWPQAFKGHSFYEDIPKVEGKTRFIVATRDPFDTELSAIKYLWRLLGIDADISPEEYEVFVSNKVSTQCLWKYA